jgi:hypothetical protein
MAIHQGVAYQANNGFAGQGVVVASRLLNAQPLRQSLIAAENANLAILISDLVYNDVVRQNHTTLRAEDFRKVAISEKELHSEAWLLIPGFNVHQLTLPKYSTPSKNPRPITSLAAARQTLSSRPAEKTQDGNINPILDLTKFGTALVALCQERTATAVLTRLLQQSDSLLRITAEPTDSERTALRKLTELKLITLLPFGSGRYRMLVRLEVHLALELITSHPPVYESLVAPTATELIAEAARLVLHEDMPSERRQLKISRIQQLLLGIILRRLIRISLQRSDRTFLSSRSTDLYRVALNDVALNRSGVDNVRDLSAAPAALFHQNDHDTWLTSVQPLRLLCSVSMYAFIAMTYMAELRIQRRRPDFFIERRYNGLSRETLNEVVAKASDTIDMFAIADWEARQLLAQPGLARAYTIVMKLPSQIHVGLSPDGEFGEIAYARDTTAEGGVRRMKQNLPNTIGGRASAAGVPVEAIRTTASQSGLTVVTWEPVASFLQPFHGLVAATSAFPHNAYLLVHTRRLKDLIPQMKALLPELRRAWDYLSIRPEVGVSYLLRDDLYVQAITDQLRSLSDT